MAREEDWMEGMSPWVWERVARREAASVMMLWMRDVICDVGGGVAVVAFQYNTNMVLWRGQSPCGGGRIGEVSSEFPLDSFVGGNKVSNNFSILYNILTSF